MTEAIFIFSLGPVQGLIAEARRVGDLNAGSHLLVQLSRAAGRAILDKDGSLIFPARLDGDVPNKLVARVPLDGVKALAQAAQQAIQDDWQEYVKKAREHLAANGPAPDDCWEAIWNRQVGSLWETYWAAAPENGNYRIAYDIASRAFDAAKRTRVFEQREEDGVKDSLSGQRSALHVRGMRAKTYWAQVAESPNITHAELRSRGRECLDAIGAVKRWGKLTAGAPSVSYIAASDFMAAAKGKKSALAMYRQTVESLLGNRLYPVSGDRDWPYDGDLFFLETLTPERLGDSYGLEQPHAGLLDVAQRALRTLYREVNSRPCPYYAIIALDGDGMGEMVRKCRTEDQHRTLSARISKFADKVEQVILKHQGHKVYAGGDDVLALAPLSTALSLAQELATEFHHVVEGTASAGIAVAHHLYPLDAVLGAARDAERRKAKQVPGKAAVCVRVLRRSGETVDVRSSWDAMDGCFEQLVSFFQNEALSSKLAYAVAEATYALPDPDEAFEAELRRQLRRHRHPTKWTKVESDWAATLRAWAACLPGKTEELGRWLMLARFIAQGGVE